MKIIIVSMILSLVILHVSCNDNPSENEDEEYGFKFEVNLYDNNSSTQSGFSVSVWNKIQNKDVPPGQLNKIGEINSGTIIRFALKQKCKVSINIYDLENNLIESMLNKEQLVVGIHQLQFNKKVNAGTNVFKCKFEVFEDSLSNNIIYQDSIYLVKISPAPIVAGIGYTDADGKFVSSNKLFFPNLYNLPELIRTDQKGTEDIGTFNILDEVIIALTNENMIVPQTRYFEREIIDGKNSFNLVWEEGAIEYPEWEKTVNTNINLNKNIIVKDKSNSLPNNYNRIDSVQYSFINSTIVNETYVLLTWGTKTESNNYGFEIQKKNSNGYWYQIGFREGYGNSNIERNYSYLDKNNVFGNLEYRLKQIDINGAYKFSKSINVSIESFYKLYQNYPNPFN